MSYPRGICLFPPLSPIPSVHKAIPYTGSSFNGGGGGGGGRGGVEEEEERSLARRFFAPLPDQKTWFQASTKRERTEISLDCT